MSEIKVLTNKDFEDSLVFWRDFGKMAKEEIQVLLKERDEWQNKFKLLHDREAQIRFERDELKAQLRGKPPLNIEASQTIPKLFDQVDELKAKLSIAVEALEFYSFPNVCFNLETKEVREFKSIAPGIVWATDYPTEESMPNPYGTIARTALLKIKGDGK